MAAAAGIKPTPRIRSVKPDSRSPARSVARRCSASANRPCGTARAGYAGACACIRSSSIELLRLRQQQVELASYDERLVAGARALHIPLYGVKD